MNENYILAYDSKTGDFFGFYLRSIHGDTIPAPNKEITNDEYEKYMGSFKRYKIDPETGNEVEVDLTPSLGEVKTNKKSLIDSECADKINAGFHSAVEQLKDSSGNVQKLLYKCDLTHQIDFAYYINTLIPAHNKGLMTDVPCTWKDASIEGPCHAITDSMAMFLYTEMGLHVQWCRTAADVLKAQVNAATTVDEVNAVAFSDEPDLDEKTMALLGITSINDLEEGNVI